MKGRVRKKIVTELGKGTAYGQILYTGLSVHTATDKVELGKKVTRVKKLAEVRTEKIQIEKTVCHAW